VITPSPQASGFRSVARAGHAEMLMGRAGRNCDGTARVEEHDRFRFFARSACCRRAAGRRSSPPWRAECATAVAERCGMSSCRGSACLRAAAHRGTKVRGSDRCRVIRPSITAGPPASMQNFTRAQAPARLRRPGSGNPGARLATTGPEGSGAPHARNPWGGTGVTRGPSAGACCGAGCGLDRLGLVKAAASVACTPAAPGPAAA